MTPSTLAALMGTWIVATASPGPDIVLVLQESLVRSRRHGLAAAVAVAVVQLLGG